MHSEVVAEALAEIAALGGEVVQDPATDLLWVNREFTASIVIARCREAYGGSLRWHVKFDESLRPDLTVAVRMDDENRRRLDYYLLPRIDMVRAAVRLREYNAVSLDAYRFETLGRFFEMAERARLQEVA